MRSGEMEFIIGYEVHCCESNSVMGIFLDEGRAADVAEKCPYCIIKTVLLALVDDQYFKFGTPVVVEE
jgi:hypothetical protein